MAAGTECRSSRPSVHRALPRSLGHQAGDGACRPAAGGRRAGCPGRPSVRARARSGRGRHGVTLRALLCHTAGLPDDVAPERAPYAIGLNWARLAQACLATPLVRPPHSHVTYSNVGYGLLALVVERRTGLPFATALAALVLDPLGIEGYLGAEPPRSPVRVAGKLGEHAGTDLEPFNSTFWRSLAMPWAGLVTTVGGALALVRAYRGTPAGFLPPDLLQAATADQTARPRRRLYRLARMEPVPVGTWPRTAGAQIPPYGACVRIAGLVWAQRLQRLPGVGRPCYGCGLRRVRWHALPCRLENILAAHRRSPPRAV